MDTFYSVMAPESLFNFCFILIDCKLFEVIDKSVVEKKHVYIPRKLPVFKNTIVTISNLEISERKGLIHSKRSKEFKRR